MSGVMHDLAPDSAAQARHEPDELTHLRRYSNYLTPRTGFMSADTWAVIATYVRNLLVNWLVLVPYFALALLVPMLADDLLPIIPATSASLTVFTFIGGACLIFSIAAIGASLPSVNPPDTPRTFGSCARRRGRHSSSRSCCRCSPAAPRWRARGSSTTVRRAPATRRSSRHGCRTVHAG